MSTTTEVIDAQLKAYRARDLEGFLAHFAHDVQVTDFDGNVLMQGIEDLRANYEPLFANSPELTVEIKSRIDTGDFVIDLEHLEGFNNPPYPQVFDAGCVYRVSGEKISAMKFLL
jgi:uncharacterized protein (TIGR02246 family)